MYQIIPLTHFARFSAQSKLPGQIKSLPRDPPSISGYLRHERAHERKSTIHAIPYTTDTYTLTFARNSRALTFSHCAIADLPRTSYASLVCAREARERERHDRFGEESSRRQFARAPTGLPGNGKREAMDRECTRIYTYIHTLTTTAATVDDAHTRTILLTRQNFKSYGVDAKVKIRLPALCLSPREPLYFVLDLLVHCLNCIDIRAS